MRKHYNLCVPSFATIWATLASVYMLMHFATCVEIFGSVVAIGMSLFVVITCIALVFRVRDIVRHCREYKLSLRSLKLLRLTRITIGIACIVMAFKPNMYSEYDLSYLGEDIQFLEYIAPTLPVPYKDGLQLCSDSMESIRDMMVELHESQDNIYGDFGVFKQDVENKLDYAMQRARFFTLLVFADALLHELIKIIYAVKL